jgi:predicted deacylase
VEGPVGRFKLEPEHIKGRVIVMPAANLPAAVEGARVSPIDGGNLNRACPGDPHGTPTFAFARYIYAALYPICVHAPEPGLFEPFCKLGETVKTGQPCGQIVFSDNSARDRIACHFKRDGLLVCKRDSGRGHPRRLRRPSRN